MILVTLSRLLVLSAFLRICLCSPPIPSISESSSQSRLLEVQPASEEIIEPGAHMVTLLKDQSLSALGAGQENQVDQTELATSSYHLQHRDDNRSHELCQPGTDEPDEVKAVTSVLPKCETFLLSRVLGRTAFPSDFV